MNTLELSDWELLAVATAVRIAVRRCTMHVEHGTALAAKLDAASRIALDIEQPDALPQPAYIGLGAGRIVVAS